MPAAKIKAPIKRTTSNLTPLQQPHPPDEQQLPSFFFFGHNVVSLFIPQSQFPNALLSCDWHNIQIMMTAIKNYFFIRGHNHSIDILSSG